MPTENQNIDLALQTLYSKIPKRYRAPSQKNLSGWLSAIAVGDGYVETLAEQVQDNLSVVSAVGRYLDIAAAQDGVSREIGAGIDDTSFQQIAPIVGSSPKKITATLQNLLNRAYGPGLTCANLTAQAAEPYAIAAGQSLQILADGGTTHTIEFQASDAANLSAATAAELAAAITLKTDGAVVGSVTTDSLTHANYLTIRTKTVGPQGFLQVVGGDAQNAFGFHLVRPISQGLTQWAVTRYGTADEMLFTISGGPNPGLQTAGVRPGDSCTIRTDSGFNSQNTGTFVVTYADATSFRVRNNQGIPETKTQAHANDITFYLAQPANILLQARRAVVRQVEPNHLVVVLPINSSIVRRDGDSACYLKSSDGNCTATTSNTIQLDSAAGLPASGAVRPYIQKNFSSSTVAAFTSTTIQLLAATGFPTKGSVYCPVNQTRYYYDGISGQTLQNVQPSPVATNLATSAPVGYEERYLYTSISGNQLQGVFPDPTGLTGFRVMQADTVLDSNVPGQYLIDRTASYTVHNQSTTTTQQLFQGDYKSQLKVQDCSAFPSSGYIVLEGYTQSEDGPIQYVGKIGTNTLVLNAKQPFAKNHQSGVSVRLVSLGAFQDTSAGGYRPAYVTSTAPIRDQIEQYLNDLIAGGVFIEFIVVLPTYRWPLPVSVFTTSPAGTTV
jgi:hypothetical protein